MTTHPSISATVATEVRALMGRKKINYTALATRTGLAPNTLRRRIFEGKGQLTIEELHALAQGLDVKPSELLPQDFEDPR